MSSEDPRRRGLPPQSASAETAVQAEATRAASAEATAGGATAPLDHLKLDDRGLLCAIAQDDATGVVWMVAWANREAVEQTLATGQAHFYSRARARLWRKGEESGNVLHVRQVRLDCDGDALLYLVDPAGPACHTGKPSCFFRRLEASQWVEDDGPAAAPLGVLSRLTSTIRQRRSATATRSYVRSLLERGAPAIAAKLREEADELIAELPAGAATLVAPVSAEAPTPAGSAASKATSKGRVAAEAADLLFHLLVGLEHADVPLDDVLAELRRREGVSGHDEKASRPR